MSLIALYFLHSTSVLLFNIDVVLTLSNISTLVQVMAWCCQATSHYLNQCWLRYLTPYGVTRPQWVKESISFKFSRLRDAYVTVYCAIIGLGYVDGLVQDHSNSSAAAMKLLQSCAKPSTSWCLFGENNFVSNRFGCITISKGLMH